MMMAGIALRGASYWWKEALQPLSLILGSMPLRKTIRKLFLM